MTMETTNTLELQLPRGDLPGLCGHWSTGKGARGEEVPPSPMGTVSRGTDRHLLLSTDGTIRDPAPLVTPAASLPFQALSDSSSCARAGHDPQDGHCPGRALPWHQWSQSLTTDHSACPRAAAGTAEKHFLPNPPNKVVHLY